MGIAYAERDMGQVQLIVPEQPHRCQHALVFQVLPDRHMEMIFELTMDARSSNLAAVQQDIHVEPWIEKVLMQMAQHRLHTAGRSAVFAYELLSEGSQFCLNKAFLFDGMHSKTPQAFFGTPLLLLKQEVPSAIVCFLLARVFHAS